MVKEHIYVFGYNKRIIFLIDDLVKKGFSITIIVSSEENYKRAKDRGCLDVVVLDLNVDEQLEALNIEQDNYIICAMEDNHINVFLTLSLHSIYPQNKIIALSNSIHATQKLKMAGASRVIDLYQVSTNRIYNILHKPVVTKLIDNILSFDSELSLREIVIPQGSCLDKIQVDNFDFNRHKIIMLGMIDKKISHQFLFITSGLEHGFDTGDTLVCMGYNEDLDRFEEFIKSRNDISRYRK